MKKILQMFKMALIMGLMSTKAFAQEPAGGETVLKGNVKDELSGETLPGVVVKVKGTKDGAVTDENGDYVLRTKATPPFVLEVAYIGYNPKEIDVYEDEPVNISLRVIGSVSEVVVMGYGEQKRADVTGSVSSVPDELKHQPVASVERLLQGTVAGAVVTQTTGQPGGGVNVQIRGINSISAGADPLYVIDGFPINNDYGVNDAGIVNGAKINPLSSINPNDIESIDVLKDASATAIYGSRGANGVVIITTKKGRKNESSITYDAYAGIQSVIKELPVMNASQWWALRKDAAFDSGKTPTLPNTSNLGYAIDTSGAGTDWQGAAFRNAAIQSHSLSFLGGTDKTRIAVTGNYFNQDGVLLNTGFKRYSGRISIDHDYNDRLKILANVNISDISSNVAPAAIVGALLLTPTSLPIYKPDGSYVLSSPFESAYQNPINSLNNQVNQSSTTRVLGNAAFEYKILEGLTAKVLIGGDFIQNKQNRYLPVSTYEGAAFNGWASIGTANTNNWLTEYTLNYSKTLRKKHRLNIVGGGSVQQSVTEGNVATAAGFGNDIQSYNNLGAGTTLIAPVSSYSKWAIASFLGRVNYAYNEKYLATLSFRADGSSRFGNSNKWGYFPSAAVAWNLHKEDFLKDVKQISLLKARFSAGLTGNQAIPPYSSIPQLSYYRYNLSNTTVAGYAPLNVTNPNLGWENTWQFDLGFDVGLFNNRVNLITDIYLKRTSNLLLNAPVSGTSGLSYYDPNNNTSQVSTVLQNIGLVENKGIEIALNTQNLIGKFKWQTTFIFADNLNKILSLGNGVSQIQPSIASPSVLQVGDAIGSFIVYQTDGVIKPGDAALTPQADKAVGAQKYKDINGDGQITQAGDRVVINNPQGFVVGLTNRFEYKGFDLTVFFQGNIGAKLYNSNEASLELGTGYTGASTVLLNRYTANNTNTDVRRAFQDPAITISDRFIEDASYVRLKNISLGYSLPAKLLAKAKIKGIRFYVSLQNYLTFTKYTGYDPEVSLNGQNPSTRGIDQSVYPNYKTAMAGITFTY